MVDGLTEPMKMFAELGVSVSRTTGARQVDFLDLVGVESGITLAWEDEVAEDDAAPAPGNNPPGFVHLAAALHRQVKRDLPLSNCNWLGTDGEAAMASPKEGLHGKMVDGNPLLVWNHCECHKDALSS